MASYMLLAFTRIFCSYGVAAGAEAFASSVVSGMEGIVVRVSGPCALATLVDILAVEANRGCGVRRCQGILQRGWQGTDRVRS